MAIVNTKRKLLNSLAACRETYPDRPIPPIYWRAGEYHHAVCRRPLIKTDQLKPPEVHFWCTWCHISICSWQDIIERIRIVA